MAVNVEVVAEKVFNLLAGNGYDISNLNSKGEKVIDPQDATRFVVVNPNILVRLDKATETLSMGVRETFEDDDLREAFKSLAGDYLMNFDYRIFGKQLQPKSETIDIAKKSEKNMGDVLEAIDELRKMAGLPLKEDDEELNEYTKVRFDDFTLQRGYDAINNELRDILDQEGARGLRRIRGREGRRYLARQLYKQRIVDGYRDADDLVDVYMKQRFNDSVQNLDEPLQELDRPSLDQDLPRNYFDNLRKVKKAIFKKYGTSNAVMNAVSDLNDEEKANGKKADPMNILMKVKNHMKSVVTAESQWEKIDEGFSSMSGSTKTSYQGLDNVKLVIRHKKEVNEEIRGSRSRNISSIFVQRGDERFKMAENNLKAARAMARHVKNGGEPFDTVGSAINEMAVEQRKLREFVRYVKKSGLVNEENESYVNLAMENINFITSSFTKLAGVKSYATAVEDVTDRRNTEVLQDDIDLESKFTETHFDDRVANVVDAITSAMSRKTAYESYIDKAVSNESFAKLKNMLSEDDGMEFATPHAKLGYQVSQMSNSVNDPRLGNYLTGISKKLYSGDRMSQHEYTTVKSCLLGAHNTQSAPTSVAESVEDQYKKFIEQFDIL